MDARVKRHSFLPKVKFALKSTLKKVKALCVRKGSFGKITNSSFKLFGREIEENILNEAAEKRIFMRWSSSTPRGDELQTVLEERTKSVDLHSDGYSQQCFLGTFWINSAEVSSLSKRHREVTTAS